MAQGPATTPAAVNQTRDKGYTIHGEIMLFVIVSVFAMFLLLLLFCVYLRGSRRRMQEESEDGGLRVGVKLPVPAGSVNFTDR
ncbi:hypothetical protein KSP40_PGU001592 [Platanthera guangdongensis]|uniref:Uncharacterized protein n=1 Tax=Platanthera guangdongensis TaxID=2320717 RepID=A0ABR2MS19_9ASPA